MPAPARDLFDSVASMVGDAGTCPDTPEGKAKIIKALNLMIEAMMYRLDSKGTLAYWCTPVYGGCIGLPEDCLAPRQTWLDGRSMTMRDEWWEGALSVGIQDANCSWNQPWVRQCRGADFIDMGDGYVSPANWPNDANTRLALTAEDQGDSGKVVTVWYLDETGTEHKEELTLLRDVQPVVTDFNVKDLVFLSKPVTIGAVNAFVQYDYRDKGIRTPFARYKPRVTVPSYRRNKIPGKFHPGCNGTLLIKGKRRFQPIIDENDIAQISNKMALRWASDALAKQEQRDPTGYNTSLTFAVNELEKELQDSNSAAASGQVQYRTPFGRQPGVRAWM